MGYNQKGLASCELPSCSGGAKVLHNSGAPTVGLAVDGSVVYWSVWEVNRGDGKILKCLDPTCANGPSVVVQGLSRLTDIEVEGDQLYFAEGALYRVPKDATNASRPTSPFASGNGSFGSFIFAGNALYFTDYAGGASALWRCDLPGCTGLATIASNLLAPGGLAALSNILYFTSRDGDFVGQCTMPSCSGGISVTAQGVARPERVIVDGTRLYWTSGGGVLGCDLPGCKIRINVTPSLFNALGFSLAVDEEAVYFATLGGPIYRVAKP